MAKTDASKVSPWDEILIGSTKALVATEQDENGTVEVVYLDQKGMAIAELVKWTGESWEFVSKEPSGTYAERSARFAEFARALKGRRN